MARSRKSEERKIAGVGGLLLVLLRWSRGWWDQATLAAQAGFHRSQVSMWERDDREVPAAALEKTAELADLLTRESHRLAEDQPEESREWETLAGLIADRNR